MASAHAGSAHVNRSYCVYRVCTPPRLQRLFGGEEGDAREHEEGVPMPGAMTAIVRKPGAPGWKS